MKLDSHGSICVGKYYMSLDRILHWRMPIIDRDWPFKCLIFSVVFYLAVVSLSFSDYFQGSQVKDVEIKDTAPDTLLLEKHIEYIK